MRFCLIGEKLGHSYSERIHAARGLTYSLKELPPSALGEFMRENEFDGFNVTIPYKKAVIEYLSALSDTARAVGSVNTVKRFKDGLHGYNTDLGGIIYTLECKNIDVKGVPVAVLGTGGAALTAVAALKQLGAGKIYCVSRTGAINYDNYYEKCTDAQVVINATPVGMFPNTGVSPVDLGCFPKLRAVMDMVYNPCRTAFIAQAQRLGVVAAGGLLMLCEQALLAQDIWLSESHNKERALEIARQLTREMHNVVLTGMPSCGKSFLGKKVAKLLNREFFDADECFTRTFGRTPESVIKEDGESRFRDMESAVIKQLSLKSGVVISTGGGAVLRSENVENLKGNGILVYVKRDIELLSTNGRPLSESQGTEKLFKARKPVYENTAEAFVQNLGNAQSVAKEIIRVYETACDKRC